MSIAPSPGAREALLAAARAELDENGPSGVSLRAAARRAGVSHAAPQYFFGSRSGMLTAVAADGFRALARALDAVDEPSGPGRVAALGRAYIDFGTRHPALFDLMFRGSDLDRDDPELRDARAASLGILAASIGQGADADHPARGTLVAWALAHGLTVLARDVALGHAAGLDAEGAGRLAKSLITEPLPGASSTPHR